MISFMSFLIKMVATVLGVGYLPLAPGTWASALAVVFAWYSTGCPICWFLGFSAVGLWACAPARKVFGKEDPSQFVMDEVCGMLLSVLWLPRTVAVYGAAFLLFRLFDVWKPGPVRSVQNSPHPWSIMLDDLLAGVFANLVLQVLTRTIWYVY